MGDTLSLHAKTEVLWVIQGCGVYKIIFTRFVHRVSLGIFSTLLATFN